MVEVRKMQTYYQKNQAGSLDIILYVSAEEMGMDFSSLKNFFKTYGWGKRRVALIRRVKIVIAGTVVLVIPFSFFAKVGANERYAMSYVYYGTGEAQLESLSVAEDTLSAVSPSYFNIANDGSLSLSGISEMFINKMHDSGIEVVPFLSNHWDRKSGENALKNGEMLARDIASAVKKYNLDGVNVDIENVTEEYRAMYTDFVRRLRELLPDNKEVSVAVAANPWGVTTGWTGSYDYEGLSKVCDHLFIMAYDEHYQGGEAGAVAGIDFVEQCIQYALTQAPAEKLVLGIPFYGRIWGGPLRGYGISLQKIESLTEQYETNVQFDTKTQTPVMLLTIKDGQAGPVIGGQKLSSGTYMIHYENADSIKAKLSLAAKYNLKGAGNWSAGQETEDVWDYYELWLNGKYFSDISEHFAKDEILQISAEGIMTGQTDTLFAPSSYLSRAEVAVICTRLLTLAKGTVVFTDVPSDHWAYDAIQRVEREGIMVGYEDGTFRPDEPVTRAEMSRLLARMVEQTYAGESGFSDVSDRHWAKEEISALARMGVLTGYPDNTFRPDNKINRGEAAVILQRIKEWL
ncbi:MAG: glycoside hydrolase [Ruminococcaceae bacterium]|nr:glycoside hydrolase [Oscillospiraceae bacterium]